MTEKLTIHDIARLAGVSTATVSRVLNNKPDVDPLTRERVLRIMQERGFQPDPLAVQPATGPQHTNHRGVPVFPTNFSGAPLPRPIKLRGGAGGWSRAIHLGCLCSCSWCHS